MQEELTILQPQLVQTSKEVEEMMVHISAEKEEADKVKAKVEVEEKIATEKASVTTAIKDDAQRDLDEALPALDAAVKCLDALKKADIDEVKSLRTPPSGVKLTLQVACYYFEVSERSGRGFEEDEKYIRATSKLTLFIILWLARCAGETQQDQRPRNTGKEDRGFLQCRKGETADQRRNVHGQAENVRQGPHPSERHQAGRSVHDRRELHA